ncbi:IS3 family transposase [Paraburkholderia tropica]|uniref:IS3 family transposase n=1 Tax=Paraburkholderia tropica TaxID=92647 RepID=UPI0012E997F6|nr:IS3 family transposase [Paraburkholderia tropica]
MSRTRRHFTDEFKREAVRLCNEPGAVVTQIARDLGIGENLLRRWVRLARDGALEMDASKPLRAEALSEVQRLQRELRRVTMERDMLKKAPRLLREGPAVKYAWIVRQRGVWPTRAMCRLLGVSHSGFYEWLGRAPGKRSQENVRLARLVRESFELSDKTYGSPRIWHDLRAAGERCGVNRVARLMQQAGLQARQRRRRMPGNSGAAAAHGIAPNYLQRQFEADAPNRKWVADFTYIWTAEGWLFVAAVMDLYSRRIVGWSMSNTMHAKMVADALLMALWRRGRPAELIHHSDQGSQYTSEDFQSLLRQQGITCSMSRRGDCWDNAAMESFFSTLKTERVNRSVYRTRDAARADVFDYIERFYNPHRRHSTLNFLSPVQFEQRMTG